jgi:hypothetical protein
VQSHEFNSQKRHQKKKKKNQIQFLKKGSKIKHTSNQNQLFSGIKKCSTGLAEGLK